MSETWGLEEEGLLALLARVGNMARRAFRGDPEDLAVGPCETEILVEVHRQPRITAAALARMLGLSRQRVHRALMELERAGVIDRETDGWRLTEDGLVILEFSSLRVAEVERALGQAFDRGELQRLRELLSRCMKPLQEQRTACDGPKRARATTDSELLRG